MPGTAAFEAVNRYLGWGEPEEGLWFIGLEEADEWDCPTEQEVISASEKLGEVSLPAESPNFAALGFKGLQIRCVLSRVMSAVSERGKSLGGDWYLNNRLWRPGSRGFQANLYPLGKPVSRVLANGLQIPVWLRA